MKFNHQYVIEGATGSETIINGEKFLYFAGTGYFELNGNSEMLKAASEATLKYGIATATTRAITGTSPLLLELEKKAAAFFDTEDAVYLPSGYLTDMAGIQALNELDTFDVVFLDEGSHYSLHEAVSTIDKPVILFKNRDPEHLKLQLQQKTDHQQRPLIASDGLFPIRAQNAPLNHYLELANQNNGVVWIDDAHGVGILGKNGRGTYEHLGLRSPRLFMGATLSKAFGAYGGIIPGSTAFVKQLKTGNVFTGSSSPMHAAVAAGIKGIELVKENPQMREKLWNNALYLKKQLSAIGIKTDRSPLPIASFSIGNLHTMTEIHKALMDEGIYIQFTNYRGSGNGSILRIVVFSTHTKQQIDFLTQKLEKVLSETKTNLS